MKKLLITVDVTCSDSVGVKGKHADVTMVPFTARAHGEEFNGETVGFGVDTQRLDKIGGGFTLSARYMLEGSDRSGNKCRVFVDNSVRDGALRPVITTDSPLLAEWEDAPLSAEVKPAEGGKVTVLIYRE